MKKLLLLSLIILSSCSKEELPEEQDFEIENDYLEWFYHEPDYFVFECDIINNTEEMTYGLLIIFNTNYNNFKNKVTTDENGRPNIDELEKYIVLVVPVNDLETGTTNFKYSYSAIEDESDDNSFGITEGEYKKGYEDVVFFEGH